MAGYVGVAESREKELGAIDGLEEFEVLVGPGPKPAKLLAVPANALGKGPKELGQWNVGVKLAESVQIAFVGALRDLNTTFKVGHAFA